MKVYGLDFTSAPSLMKPNNGCRRIVVEAYPKLVANKLIPKSQYKNGDKKKQTPAKEKVCRKIVKKLKSDLIISYYGFEVKFDNDMENKIVNDPMGDYLDALLCVIQAGWAYEQREFGYGIPDGFELEGWIVDPELNEQSNIKSKEINKKYE